MTTEIKDSLNKFANTIRFLSMDAVEWAKSGHPGMPMGMAEIGVALWHHHLKHNPCDPTWYDRDRFVLSNGHGSMLLYSLLHLTGYTLTLEDIKSLRKFKSKTPAHPEFGITPGVETTTGPLGQGLANAVGMALAESLMAKQFNYPDLKIIDHYTFVFVGDGCLMEGISHEACSLAGTLQLSKLIVLYDQNNISIDGNVENWFGENTAKRFEAYGWHVIEDVDGHDIEAVTMAIGVAKQQSKPSLIMCKTLIGKGSPNKVGKSSVHGAPLGSEEIQKARMAVNWPFAPFIVPQDVYSISDAKQRGRQWQADWNKRFSQYCSLYPEKANEYMRRMSGSLPVEWPTIVQTLRKLVVNDQKTPLSTRKASQNAIEAFARYVPEFLGGSADLTGSNLTNWSRSIPVTSHKIQTSALDAQGQYDRFLENYIHYGVREFGMSAIMNGIALHGGWLPFGGTFLTFSDYSRNALRMAALMKARSIFVCTHDSIGLGEDGPTHQPIEHLASLRFIPNLDVWRPADAVETMIAWEAAIERAGPSCLVFSRQTVPLLSIQHAQTDDIKKGGYVLRDWDEKKLKKIIIIATGSEVGLACQVKVELENYDISARIVSMPSTSVFDRQLEEWKTNVLLKNFPRVAIEAGTTDFWWKYVGLDGEVFGIDKFGESGSPKDLYSYFGLTVDHIVAKIKSMFA